MTQRRRSAIEAMIFSSVHITSHQIIWMCLCALCAICVCLKCTHHSLDCSISHSCVRVLFALLYDDNVVILTYCRETDSSNLAPWHAKMPFKQRVQACITLYSNDRDFMMNRGRQTDRGERERKRPKRKTAYINLAYGAALNYTSLSAMMSTDFFLATRARLRVETVLK